MSACPNYLTSEGSHLSMKLTDRLRAIFASRSSDRTELNRLRESYSTLLAENACLIRKEAALRGENKVLRVKYSGIASKPVIKL